MCWSDTVVCSNELSDFVFQRIMMQSTIVLSSSIVGGKRFLEEIFFFFQFIL
jgi:hypothetical protein